MEKIKTIGAYLFIGAVVGYFWLVLLLDFSIFTNVMGHFNFVPPKISVENYFVGRWNLLPDKHAKAVILKRVWLRNSLYWGIEKGEIIYST